jgi:hypothetical protein
LLEVKTAAKIVTEKTIDVTWKKRTAKSLRNLL